MHDLQDIEKELYENDGMNHNHSFDLDDQDEFNLGSISNSGEFNIDEDDKDLKEEKNAETLESTSPATESQPQNQQTAILEILNAMTEVDAEVRTTVPDKILSFLDQYGIMKGWKIVQISNYLLLKIPRPNQTVVEYALKFDPVDSTHYAIKFLKNETITNEQFHTVGSFILNLLNPYCN
jgi:hypothetical protein